MASKYAIERARGKKEARQQLASLRERWPLAFPAKNQEVRPLSIGAAREIAAAMGWQLPYTLGVLGSWKMEPAYCEAVLRYDQRITLDGAPAEMVEAKARDLASKRLAELAAGKATKAAAKTVKPTLAEHKSAPAASAETAEQLRARVRASLLRRSA
jgi:sRNA-binding protein